MVTWEVTQLRKRRPKLTRPVLITGLPGIGNVGKIAVDFLIDELKAKKLFELFSYDLPNSVFVNEDNLVDLPKIEVYHKKGTRDILLLTGDAQPVEERASFELCEAILTLLQQLSVTEIITLGGIGLAQLDRKPQIFSTGNQKEFIEKFVKGTKVNTQIYGTVGPIIGVTGLLLGLSERYGMRALALLAETVAQPNYLGVRGAEEIIDVLQKRLKLGLHMKRIRAQIDELEGILSEVQDPSQSPNLKKLRSHMKSETTYIG